MQAGTKDEAIVWRAAPEDLNAAFQIVTEYYQAASVIARESKDEFAEYYFAERSGLWLASFGEKVVGCIALRELQEPPRSGEIKRMDVQLAHRKHGIAKALFSALETFASGAEYDWLYLDSAPGMDTAINFYRRHGYEPCERYNDNPQANIYLRKKIR